MTAVDQSLREETYKYFVVKFLFHVIHGQRPLEVDCDKLKTYTLNTRATTKIVKQKVIANKLTKKRKKKS